MTREQASTLALALSLGYTIIIEAGSYVTGPVTSIDYRDPDEPDECDDGISGWVYTDDTVTDRPLFDISLDEVKVFQRIDFTIPDQLEQQLEDHEFEYADQTKIKPRIKLATSNHDQPEHICNLQNVIRDEEEDDDDISEGPNQEDDEEEDEPIDPETKHYRDHTTYLERHSGEDDDDDFDGQDDREYDEEDLDEDDDLGDPDNHNDYTPPSRNGW